MTIKYQGYLNYESLTIDLKELEAKYNAAVRKYIEEFEKKQDVYFEFWVADRVGEVACFGDYFFNFDDIRFDIDSEIPKGEIVSWFDLSLDGDFKVNYRTYCMNLNQ